MNSISSINNKRPAVSVQKSFNSRSVHFASSEKPKDPLDEHLAKRNKPKRNTEIDNISLPKQLVAIWGIGFPTGVAGGEIAVPGNFEFNAIAAAGICGVGSATAIGRKIWLWWNK